MRVTAAAAVLRAAALCAAAALAAAAAFSSCASRGGPLGRGPVVIGLIADLSSDGARRGNDVLKGAKLRARVINEAGGIEGTPVRLEALDMKGSPVEAAKALSRLSADLHACAVIDATFAAGLVLGSAADSLPVPLVSLSADDRVTTPELFESTADYPGVLRRFSFLIEPTESQIAGAVARYALQRFPVTRYATLFDAADPRSVMQAGAFGRAVKQAGKLLVAEEELPAAGEDPAEALKRIADAQPEAVFICGSAERNTPAVRGGLGPDVALLGNETWAEPFLEQAGGTIRNAWFAVPTEAGPDVLASIAARFQETFGEAPRPDVVPGWDAAGLVADALLRARSAEPHEVADALEHTRGFAGMLGPVDLDPVTHRAAGPPVTIMRISGGRYSVEDSRFPVMP